ncbi:MAG: hypothetical protein ABJC12_03690 [Saprospiraceae bacterium]
MIDTHLYTNSNETGLYPEGGETVQPVYVLSQGTWLGELGRKNGWIHVISIVGEGWVKAENVETREPFNLHARFTPGKPIEYVSTAA